eukprot:403346476
MESQPALKKETILEKYLRIKVNHFPVQNPVNYIVKDGNQELHLHSVEFPNKGELKGVVFFIPGYGEYVDFFGTYFEDYAKQGFRVFAFDRRGFGKSEGVRGDIGPDIVQDILGFIDLVVEQFSLQSSKKYLYGISMGSMLCARVIQLKPEYFEGAMLTVPWFATPEGEELGFFKRLALRFISCCSRDKVVPRTPRTPEFEEFFHHRSANDPFQVSFIKYHTVNSALDLQDLVRNDIDKIRIPIFMGLAGQDWLVSNKVSEEYFERFPNQHKKKVFHQDSLHQLYNQDGQYQIMQKESLDWLISINDGTFLDLSSSN